MAQIKLRHPDHETRDDDGIYLTDDPVEAMNLQTRGYELIDDGGGKAAKSPGRGGSSSTSSSSSSSSSSGSGSSGS